MTRKQIVNAAEAYACAYQIAILTDTPILHPCRVRNSVPLPVPVLPAPAAVIAALIGVQTLQGANDDQLSASLRHRVELVMNKLHPAGRDWVSVQDLEAWHKRLFAAWKPYLALFPLDVDGITLSPSQSPRVLDQSAQPQQPGPDLVQHANMPTPDVEMVEAESLSGTEIVAVDLTPEVPAPEEPHLDPEEQAAQQEYVALMSALEESVRAKLATLPFDIAGRLAALRTDRTIHSRQNASPENQALAERVRKLLVNRRKIGSRGMEWAQLLEEDGFDLGTLPKTVAQLTQEARRTDVAGQVARNRLNGYYFQIRMMLQAWEESRLYAVEYHTGLEVNRYVDSREWCVDGVCCFREYKSYDPKNEPNEAFKKDFAQQLFDYGRAFGTNGVGGPTEYVFENGVPGWARKALEARKAMFAHGLFIIDGQGGTRECL